MYLRYLALPCHAIPNSILPYVTIPTIPCHAIPYHAIEVHATLHALSDGWMDGWTDVYIIYTHIPSNTYIYVESERKKTNINIDANIDTNKMVTVILISCKYYANIRLIEYFAYCTCMFKAETRSCLLHAGKDLDEHSLMQYL